MVEKYGRNIVEILVEIWLAFIERHADIEWFVQSIAPSSLLVQDLVIKIVKMRDVNVVKLILHETCLYIKPSTVLFMFELKHCVQNVFSELCHTYIVNKKFKYFVTLLGENCIIDKCNAVDFLRKIYNKKIKYRM